MQEQARMAIAPEITVEEMADRVFRGVMESEDNEAFNLAGWKTDMGWMLEQGWSCDYSYMKELAGELTKLFGWTISVGQNEEHGNYRILPVALAVYFELVRNGNQAARLAFSIALELNNDVMDSVGKPEAKIPEEDSMLFALNIIGEYINDGRMRDVSKSGFIEINGSDNVLKTPNHIKERVLCKPNSTE